MDLKKPWNILKGKSHNYRILSDSISLKNKKNAIKFIVASFFSTTLEVLVIREFFTGFKDIDALNNDNSYVIKLLLLVLVSFGLKMYVQFWSTRLSFLLGTDVGAKVYSNTLNSEYIYYVEGGNKISLDILTNKLNMFINGFLRPIFMLFTSAFLMISVIFLVVVELGLLTLALLVLFFLFFGGYFYLTKRIVNAHSVKINLYSEKRTFSIQKGLLAIREILLFNFSDKFIEEYIRFDGNLRHSQAVNSFISISPKLVLELISLLAIVTAVLIVDHTYLGLALGGLFGLAVSVQKLIPASQSIFQSISTMQSYRSVAEDILKVLDKKSVRTEVSTVVSNDFKLDKIVLRNLSFQYSNTESHLVFKDCVLDYGKVYRLSGPSGAGKSTWVSILAGLFQESSGQITINGLSLAPHERRQLVALMSQDCAIPTTNVKDAFTLYCAGIELTKIAELLDLVELSDVINADSDIGFNGSNLSGGQRQRLVLALTLSSNRLIVVLDESTTGLESELEKRIMQKIRTIIEGKIIVIISHNESINAFCDHIIRVA